MLTYDDNVCYKTYKEWEHSYGMDKDMVNMLNKMLSLDDPCVEDFLAGYLPGMVSTIISCMITLNVMKRTKNKSILIELTNK